MGAGHHDDPDEAGLDAREWPDEADMDDSEEEETLPCPFCRKPVYENADICAHCGNFVHLEDRPRRHPAWIIAVALVLLTLALALVGKLLLDGDGK